MMKKLRVGVVGVGHIGSNHARLYAEIPAADFAAIYDVDLAKANTIGKKFRARAAQSLDEFVELVDAASVATTPATPASWRSWRRGTGLFCKWVTSNDSIRS